MSCWCGHGPWHYHEYPYMRSAYAPPAVCAHPPSTYPVAGGYGRRRRLGRRAEADELADYLHELEAEIAHIRGELDELRATDATEG